MVISNIQVSVMRKSWFAMNPIYKIFSFSSSCWSCSVLFVYLMPIRIKFIHKKVTTLQTMSDLSKEA